MSEIGYRAIITPTALGGWDIAIEEFWVRSGKTTLGGYGSVLWDKNREISVSHVRTSKVAAKEARRLLRLHRRALTNLEREGFEIAEEGQ